MLQRGAHRGDAGPARLCRDTRFELGESPTPGRSTRAEVSKLAGGPTDRRETPRCRVEDDEGVRERPAPGHVDRGTRHRGDPYAVHDGNLVS